MFSGNRCYLAFYAVQDKQLIAVWVAHWVAVCLATFELFLVLRVYSLRSVFVVFASALSSRRNQRPLSNPCRRLSACLAFFAFYFLVLFALYVFFLERSREYNELFD